jgi:hypothetical protein
MEPTTIALYLSAGVLLTIVGLALWLANDPERSSEARARRRQQEETGNVYIIMPPAPQEVRHTHIHEHRHLHAVAALPDDLFADGQQRQFIPPRRSLSPLHSPNNPPRVVSVDRPRYAQLPPPRRLLTAREYWNESNHGG